MSNVAVIGLFCTGKEVSDGQSVKTRIVTEELERNLGKGAVKRIDTYGWKNNPAKLFAATVAAVQSCENVIFMTDEGGIKVFPWLLRYANVRKNCRLHYVVVGAWLVHFLEKHAFIAECLKHYHGIYVETKALKQGLEAMGFRNVILMPNCKGLRILEKTELCYDREMPYRLCTFSRVMREKGIAEAAEAVMAVNRHYEKQVFSLDIYGPVDPGQKTWFKEMMAGFSPEVRYGGIVPYDASVETIRNYHALLFPTAFFTEGIPGTIIDAYAAGVPVICSRWENFADVVEDGRTGIGYSFEKPECLTQILMELAENPRMIYEMKPNCLEKARGYLPETVMDILLNELQ